MAEAGAAVNMTIDEASAAVEERSSRLAVHCRVHKTGLSYGPAVMVLEGKDVGHSWHYFQTIRPKQKIIASCANTFLVSGNGKPFTNNRDYCASLTHKFGLPKLPNSTSTRKAGATRAVSTVEKDQLEVVAQHMTHSTATSEKCYRNRQRTATAVTAFEAIKTISTGKQFTFYKDKLYFIITLTDSLTRAGKKVQQRHSKKILVQIPLVVHIIAILCQTHKQYME